MRAACRNWGVWKLEGRLGNRLMTLGAVLAGASFLNLCFAYMQPDDIAQLQWLINFPSNPMLDMAEPQGTNPAFLPPSPCQIAASSPYEVVRASQLMQDFFVNTGRLRCSKPTLPELGPDGLVIHIRSGDIMEYSTPGGYDPQPPCSWYVKVIEEGKNGTAFDHVLVVTQPDFRNPCLNFLRTAYNTSQTSNTSRPSLRIQSKTVTEDACMIATAQNVATGGWSTFDTGVLRLNVHLRSIHVPFGEDFGTRYYTWGWWPKHFTNWIVDEMGMHYDQYVYTFTNYDTHWANWGDRVQRMTSYPREYIFKRAINRTSPVPDLTAVKQ